MRDLPLDARKIGKGERSHLLVVDDDTRLAELLQRYLHREGFQVSIAHNASEARTLLAYFCFAAMILDIRMPGEDGMNLTESLRQHGEDIPILLLSAEGEVETRVRGLELGADDYLTKPFETAELKARLGAMIRRNQTSVTPETILILGDMRYDVNRHTLSTPEQTQSLSGKEQIIMGMLAAAPHQVLSRADLHTACGGEGNERTVDTLIARLRRKIEPVAHQPRFLQTIHGRGYVLRPDQVIAS